MLVLYSGPLSLFTAKVRVALAEKGLAYERIEVGWSLADRYLPHHPDVVELNPKAQVPVLLDGDVCVYDSTLILEYLDEAHPEPSLLPRGAALRARCRQLEAWADEIFFPHVWDLIEEGFYPAPSDGRDDAKAANARRELARMAEELDGALARGGPFLCGDAFTIADIGVFIMWNAARTLGFAPDEARLGRLLDWDARVRTRPAVATELEETSKFLASVLAGGPAAPGG